MSRTAVPARPIAVARITSPMAAPPAGGWLAAIAANVTLSLLLRVRSLRASDVRGVKQQGNHDKEDRPAEERHVHEEMSGVRDQRHDPGELLPRGASLTRSITPAASSPSAAWAAIRPASRPARTRSTSRSRRPGTGESGAGRIDRIDGWSDASASWRAR